MPSADPPAPFRFDEALDAGDAWFRLPASRRAGRVLAAFRRAVYLEIDEAVVAVVAAEVPPGPLHLRLRTLPPVSVRGELSLDWRAPTRWRPPAIDPVALAAAAWESDLRLDLARHSELARGRVADEVSSALASGELDAVVHHLGGRGGGLTPAGDDVLAGIVLVLALAGRDREDLAAAVAGAHTHPISLAFLEWAARGQAVDPVHALLAAFTIDDQEAVARHQAGVASIGHTSGVDLLLGLRLGLTHVAG